MSNEETSNEETVETPPKITFDVAGVLPIHDDVALVLVADGTVRWTQIQKEEEAES